MCCPQPKKKRGVCSRALPSVAQHSAGALDNARASAAPPPRAGACRVRRMDKGGERIDSKFEAAPIRTSTSETPFRTPKESVVPSPLRYFYTIARLRLVQAAPLLPLVYRLTSAQDPTARLGGTHIAALTAVLLRRL